MTATETRIVTKRLRDRPDDSWTLAAVKETGGYDALRKALTLDPIGHRRGGQGVGAARPRRRRIPHRHEVVVPAGRRGTPLPRRELRRGRAVDVQGPDAGRARPPPAGRGHRHRQLRPQRSPRLRLRAGRVRPRRRAAGGGRAGGPGRRPHRAEHVRIRLRSRDHGAPGSRRLHLRRRDGPAQQPGGRPGHAPHPAPVPGHRRPLRQAHGGQQRRDALHTPGHHPDGRRRPTALWASNAPGAAGSSPCRATSSGPATTSWSWASPSAS